IMTKLRQLTEETGASLCNVVHLRRMSGDKGHERGGEVTLNQLRGSHSIAQLSDAVISGERDQQSDCEFESNLLQLRVLKNRYAGMVGPAGWLYYDRKTGRLTEVHDKEAWLSEMKNEEF
ncbi:MAG: topoisomerase, partial [archaeon]|nr:topoisomerase [archaeon]